MSRRYKACPIFWDGRPQRRYLANLETLRRRLDEGWRVTRVDCLPTDTKSGTSDTTLMYILEKSDDEPETIHSSEQLDHERRKAWREGYAAGWKDHECDFPPYTSGNPYKETNKIGKDGERWADWTRSRKVYLHARGVQADPLGSAGKSPDSCSGTRLSDRDAQPDTATNVG